MKKLLLFLLVLSSIQFSIAQTETQLPKDISERRHELKLDAIKLLSIPAIELNYEYIKDVNQGFGATLLINTDDENYFEIFSFSPYFLFSIPVKNMEPKVFLLRHLPRFILEEI